MRNSSTVVFLKLQLCIYFSPGLDTQYDLLQILHTEEKHTYLHVGEVNV